MPVTLDVVLWGSAESTAPCRLIVQPLLWLHGTFKSARGERTLQQRVAAAKQQAVQQQDLLRAAVARQASEEDRRSGLVIIRAAFGNTASFRKRLEQQQAMFAQHTQTGAGDVDAQQWRAAPPDGWLDVTVALQFLVVDSQVRACGFLCRTRLNCIYVRVDDYLAVSTRTITPPATGTH